MSSKRDRLVKISEMAILYRGQVIEKMSYLEKFMDMYISMYLTNNDATKAQEMQLYILGDNRIALDSKRIIFQKIAQENDSNWFYSYKTTRKSESKDQITIGTDLTYVIEQRNIFAHCIADTSEEGILRIDELGFVRFKDKAKTYWYTIDDISILLNVIMELSTYIHERNKKDNLE